MDTSVPRGKAAEWVVSTWAKNGTVSGAKVSLTVKPASQAPYFSGGCPTEGTASCALGAVDSSSTTRELGAEVVVPTTATSVTSVTLTVTGTATDIKAKAKASLTVSLTSPGSATVPAPTTLGPNGSVTSPLSPQTLPFLNGSGSTLSPGGNAAGLFPALSPSDSDSQPPTAARTGASTRPVADTAALAQSTSVLGAQLAGLCALALAFFLAVTRLSVRRRPATAIAQKDPGNKSM